MSWGESVGLTVLTTVAGGTSFLGCAALLHEWYNMSELREGQAGYFIVIMTLLGLAGGCRVGLGTALTMRSALRTRFPIRCI